MLGYIKTIADFLDDDNDSIVNQHYGPQTKRAFKAMLDTAKQPMELAVGINAYMATHNVTL